MLFFEDKQVVFEIQDYTYIYHISDTDASV